MVNKLSIVDNIIYTIYIYCTQNSNEVFGNKISDRFNVTEALSVN